MRITFETNQYVLQACVPPAWRRTEQMIAYFIVAAIALGVSALFWVLGMRGAVAGGWTGIGVVLAILGWQRLLRRGAAAAATPAQRVTLELLPQGVLWHWQGLKELRYDWRWFRRAGYSDQGIALELADRSGMVIAPRDAFRSLDEFRQACAFIDSQMLATAGTSQQRMSELPLERRLPLRTDIGQIYFRNAGKQPRSSLPPISGRYWGWCLFSAALTLGAWALSGLWGTILGGLALLLMIGLANLSADWLRMRRTMRLRPPLFAEFVMLADEGIYCGHALSDEFIPWSSVADAQFDRDVLQLFNAEGERVAGVNLAEFSSPAAADEFAEKVFARIHALESPDEDFDDEDDDEDFEDNQTWQNEEEENLAADDTPPPPAPLPAIERNLRICAYFLPLLFFGLGMWGNWPHIELEHRRMELWRVPMFWMSEVTALFWYLVFGVRLILGKSRPRGVSLWVWLTFAAGISMDLGITLSERREEHQAFARSVVAQAAQATSAKIGLHRGRRLLRRLDCEFTDAQGAKHTAIFDSKNTQFPAEVEQAAIGGKFPQPIEIRYDPQRPQRHWLAATSDPHYNRLYILGAVVIILGTPFGMLFILLRRDNPNFLPAEIAPFLAASFLFGLTGTLYLIFG